jgi:hypothetical protein
VQFGRGQQTVRCNVSHASSNLVSSSSPPAASPSYPLTSNIHTSISCYVLSSWSLSGLFLCLQFPLLAGLFFGQFFGPEDGGEAFLRNVDGHSYTALQSRRMYNYYISGHYPFSCVCLKMFQRLDSVSVFWWNVLSWAQSIELVPNSGPDLGPSE